MPSVPLATSFYKRSQLPTLTLKNMYFERTPVNVEDNVALFPRPRLKQFAITEEAGILGNGPMMGLYREGGVLAAVGLGGAIIAKSGPTLYRVTQTGLPGVGTAVEIGDIDGTFRMTAEGNASVVVVTCGQTPYTTDGTNLAPITFPNSYPVYAVDQLAAYFLFATALGRFYWSSIGGTTVSALDYATAESQPDDLLSLKVIRDELWLFGRLTVEVWQPTGDADLPFQRIGGRVFGIGVTARETVQKISIDGIDTICWLGTDRRVYRTNPNPERISDPALEEILQKIEVSVAASGSNPWGTAASWNGHDFYVLHIPGYGAYACDLASGKWDEWTSYQRDVFRGSVWAVGPNSQPLIGDVTTNQIWELTESQRTDGDQPVVFEFSGLVENPGAPVRCDNLSLDIATGYTETMEDDPMIGLQFSDDMGRTFSDFWQQPLGRMGQYVLKVLWPRLGLMKRPGRIFRWKTTEPVTVRKAKYNQDMR